MAVEDETITAALNCDNVWVLLTNSPARHRVDIGGGIRRGDATTADELILFDEGFFS